MRSKSLTSSSDPLRDLMMMAVRTTHTSAADDKAMNTLIWNEHGPQLLNEEDEQVYGQAISGEKSQGDMNTYQQEDGTPVINWTTFLMMPFPPLPKELVELVLPAGCSMPAQAISTAHAIRKQVITSLWPLIQGDVIRELAFVICVNRYADAQWWIRAGVYRSQETVMKQLTTLLAWRVA
ncbi:MAG: hypothetical protein ACYDER_08080 [Ktedonobacteraceae bacterium]